MDRGRGMGLVISLGGKKPRGDYGDEPEAGSETDDAEYGEMLASEVLDAIGDKDPAALYSAMRGLVEHCSGE